jgi:hypothetical protein
VAILIVVAAIFCGCLIVMAAMAEVAHRRPVTTFDAMCEAVDRSIDRGVEAAPARKVSAQPAVTRRMSAPRTASGRTRAGA